VFLAILKEIEVFPLPEDKIAAFPTAANTSSG